MMELKRRKMMYRIYLLQIMSIWSRLLDLSLWGQLIFTLLVRIRRILGDKIFWILSLILKRLQMIKILKLRSLLKIPINYIKNRYQKVLKSIFTRISFSDQFQESNEKEIFLLICRILLLDFIELQSKQ